MASGRPQWTLLASGDETNGSFELFQEIRAGLGGPAPHVHHQREEAFFVLAGRYVFVRGSEELEVGPGEMVVVPRGIRHAFRTLVAPSRTLIIVAPAGLAGYFREMATRVAAGQTPLEAMTALSTEYDTHPVP